MVTTRPEHRGFTVFGTSLGTCGIGWGPGGITGVELPAPALDTLLATLTSKHPDAARADPPPSVRAIIDRIDALLAGRSRDDLEDITLDMSGLSGFLRKTYTVLRTVNAGTTVTYGELAERLGSPGLARAVGRAMGANPFPIIVPCHRVLGADGAIGGFSAPFGAAMKRRMLLREGVAEQDGPALFGHETLYPERRPD